MDSAVIDVYDYVRLKAAGRQEGAEISVRTISEQTGLSQKQVREQIRCLISKGYISVENRHDKQTGGQLSSVYRIIGLPPSSPARGEMARAIYVRYASERAGKELSGTYFVHYRSHFERIAAICEELKMDLHAYILACFHSLSAGWCRKTFKVPYPPPQILASKNKARERYDNFIRQFQHEFDGETGPTTWVMQSVHMIKKLKIENNVEKMAHFVLSGNLLQEVFMCMPSVSKDDWKLADIDESKVDVQTLKVAHSVVYQEFVKEKKP